jgi:hypothetical protein
MFAGVYGLQLFLRLAPRERAELQESLGAKAFEPMAGRPMKEYLSLPEAVWNDPEALDEWMRRSVEFTVSLPPKEPKPRKTGGGGGGGPPPPAPPPPAPPRPTQGGDDMSGSAAYHPTGVGALRAVRTVWFFRIWEIDARTSSLGKKGQSRMEPTWKVWGTSSAGGSTA